MKKSLYILGVGIALLMSSCSSSWLDQHPGGSTITEEQYYKMDDIYEGTVTGIMAQMNSYGNHDWFGQRAIDMYSDFSCGDMAMKTCKNGWFEQDELGQSYNRRGTLWSYYYNIVRACNTALNVAHTYIKEEQFTDSAYILEHGTEFYYLAEILTLRGWAYANLQKWFCYTPTYITTVLTESLDEHKSIPLYTEADTKVDTIYGNELSSVTDVYVRIEEDLNQAVFLFDILEDAGYSRSMKQELNSDVARLILAYHYLNSDNYELAASTAVDFINYTNCTLLDTTNLTTTGFAKANDNWVWGQEVTVQTTNCLASFFGQCDIYSYSYASIGDIKGIDEALYNSIPVWDKRQYWWNNMYRGCKASQWAPDGKFYSPSVQAKVGYNRQPTSQELDRDWLCDQVFMRTELGYIIAAEAYARLNNYQEGLKYLKEITDRRYIGSQKAEYDKYIAGITNAEELKVAVYKNWRIEFWGEGFGMQTMRRYEAKVQLGTNHRSRTEVDPNSNLRAFTFEIPSGEQYYNPYLHTDNTKLTTDE